MPKGRALRDVMMSGKQMMSGAASQMRGQMTGGNKENGAAMMGKKSMTSAPSKAKVGKVMSEFKVGSLHSGSKAGPTVTNRKQAIAIAISEAKKAKE